MAQPSTGTAYNVIRDETCDAFGDDPEYGIDTERDPRCKQQWEWRPIHAAGSSAHPLPGIDTLVKALASEHVASTA